MAYDWIKSQFTASDLNGKSVEFRIPFEPGGFLQGEGKLEAAQDARGLVKVALKHTQMTKQGMFIRKFFIPSEEVQKIVKNPPGSICEFTFHAL